MVVVPVALESVKHRQGGFAMFRVLTLAAALLAAAVVVSGGSSAAQQKTFPEVIQLPAGFQPEGIEIKATTFYVGSRVTGAIYRGNLRTGAGATLVPGGAGRPATGIEFDNHNRLWVAGAGSGNAYLYNANTGALIRTYDFANAPTFINDVVVTRNAAYFTDSQKKVLYHVPIGPGGAVSSTFHTIALTGDFVLEAGFNLNGIDATKNGKTLIAVQSGNGKLFRIDPATGVTREISLGGESVPTGDGILLKGKKLYVVQNTMNRVAVISLAPNLASGRLLARLSDPDFSVPTTIDDLGKRLWAVNARFGVANPDSAAYQVVLIGKPKVK
jgi:sugar lactone lactonase YvrE